MSTLKRTTSQRENRRCSHERFKAKICVRRTNCDYLPRSSAERKGLHQDSGYARLGGTDDKVNGEVAICKVVPPSTLLTSGRRVPDIIQPLVETAQNQVEGTREMYIRTSLGNVSADSKQMGPHHPQRYSCFQLARFSLSPKSVIVHSRGIYASQFPSLSFSDSLFFSFLLFWFRCSIARRFEHDIF